MLKKIFAAALVGMSSNLFAAEFTSISLQGRLSSTDTINNVRVFLDAADLGLSLTLVPDAKGVFSTKFSVSPPDALSQCSACLISLKKTDGTVLSTSSLRSVPFALTVRGDGPDANLIRASGNIGINTSNPAYKLDVYGDVRSTGSYYGNGINLTGVLHSETDPLSVKKTGDTMSGTLNMGSQQITGAGSLTMSTGTITGNAFSVGGATLAVVNGRVGIGTASPGANLDVAGNVKIADGTQGLGKVLTSNASGLATWQVPASTFSIGDNYGGGKIFWIDAAGKQVLIAATIDQAAGVKWSNNSSVTGASFDGVYAGKANTVLISTMQGAGNYAARICSDYSVTINNEYYDDWYLPSKYELSRLYENRAAVGNFPVTPSLYWSSNEDVMLPSSAWQVAFPSGGLANNLKYNTSSTYVRCTRSGPSTSIGNLPTNAETVTDGAYLTSTQTFTGLNKFNDLTATTLTTASATITGSVFSVGGSTLVITNGKVGISSATPTEALSIEGNVNITGIYKTNGVAASGLGDAILSATQTFTGANTFGQKLSVVGEIQSTTGGFKFPDGTVQITSAPISWGSFGNNIYSLSYAVGIGTKNPAGVFEVDNLNYTYSYGALYNWTWSNPRCPCDTSIGHSPECSSAFSTYSDLGSVCYDWVKAISRPYQGMSHSYNREAPTSQTSLSVSREGKVGVGTATPNQKLSVAGIIESTSGGVKFPDGTVQASAASQALVKVTSQYVNGPFTIPNLSMGRYKLIVQLIQNNFDGSHYIQFNNDSRVRYKWSNYSGISNSATYITVRPGNNSQIAASPSIYAIIEFTTEDMSWVFLTGTATYISAIPSGSISGTVINGYYYGEDYATTLTYGTTSGGFGGRIDLYKYN